jgi:hypothetical protein
VYVSREHLGGVICEHMASSNNPLVLFISCYVVCPTPTHWTADWILTGVQVVPVMPIGCWAECLSRYQQFLTPVYWFVVRTLSGFGSAFREQHCKSDFKVGDTLSSRHVLRFIFNSFPIYSHVLALIC